MKKYKFIGNENDPLTKNWGIKYGNVYDIELRFIGVGLGTFSAKICIKEGYVECPYSSEKTFFANWEEVSSDIDDAFGVKSVKINMSKELKKDLIF